MMEKWFDGLGTSPHCFPLTTRTAEIYTTKRSWCNHSLLLHYDNDGLWYVVVPFFR